MFLYTRMVNLLTEELMTIRKELLDILACPICKGEVVLSDREEGLICNRCSLMYPIQDNIPVMLIDKAVKLK
jgi:uncharacterized protein YbaR (Trm112 family)